MAEGRVRVKIAIGLFIAAFLAGAAALLMLRQRPGAAGGQAGALSTLGGPQTILPGDVTSARKKIDPGKSEKAVVEAIGKPSNAVETKGLERHTIWTYDYADGNLTLNLTDGYLVRVDTEYGPTRRGRPRE